MSKDRKPTKKQTTALQLINNGLSPRQAMLKAGYSEEAANHPKRLFKSQGVQALIDKFQFELSDVGVTTNYLAKKYAEWLDATKKQSVKVSVDDKGRPIFELVDMPDYNVQIEAGKMLKEVFNLKPDTKKNEGLAKRVTFEEFVMSD